MKFKKKLITSEARNEAKYILCTILDIFLTQCFKKPWIPGRIITTSVLYCWFVCVGREAH